MKQKAKEIVDHLFRHESGHIISRLSVRYGMLHLSEIEDAVSEALVRAIKTWAIDVPESPAAWLYSVSSRILIDTLRKKQLYFEKIVPNYKIQLDDIAQEEDEYVILKLMLWCVHPSLDTKDQLGLILQLVSGFSIKEIASALLANPESVKKRLQRARAKLKSLESGLQLNDINDVEERLPTLRAALYLGFNEGYYSIHHDNIFREDLIYESLRLCKLLCDTLHSDMAISQSLMSLMLFHTSRIPARRSIDNTLILFENQDRQLWNRTMIALASDYLEKAMESRYNTPYHIEAVIAGIHTNTIDYKETDWGTIAKLYQKLLSVSPNPMIKLNYVFALVMSMEYTKAWQILTDTTPEDYGVHKYLFHSVKALYFYKTDNHEKNKFQLWKAIDTAPNKATRDILKDRLRDQDVID